MNAQLTNRDVAGLSRSVDQDGDVDQAAEE